MKQKILLIGGTGILSTDVMNLSLKKEHVVYILNRGNHAKSIPQGVILLQANIKNADEVNRVIKDLYFDIVVDFISYNKTDLKNSLSIFQNKCGQFIFISSACVYRRNKSDGKITEESPLGKNNWDYSTNKVACEEYLISKCSEVGLKYSIVRPYITYGITRLPYGIMPPYGWHWTLIARILKGKPVFLWDDGTAICTITHTSDFAKGLVGLFGNSKSYNEAFHIISDESISWKGLICLIGELINKKPLIVEIPSVYVAAKLPFLKGMLLGDRSLDAIFDNSKIKNTVPEFICTTPLKKGISQTIEYYRDNNFLNGIDYKWDAQMDKLICDYLKETSPDRLKGLNLKFEKYLEGSFTGKIMYYQYRCFSETHARIHELVDKILHQFKR